MTYSPLAVWTGLEPATPCVTGRYSNQLNYHTVPLLHRKDSISNRNYQTEVYMRIALHSFHLD